MSKSEDIHQEPTLEKEEMNLTISCSALAGIATLQTLNIDGQTKRVKNVLKDMFVSFHMVKKKNGSIGYLCLNGGITLHQQ